MRVQHDDGTWTADVGYASIPCRESHRDVSRADRLLGSRNPRTAGLVQIIPRGDGRPGFGHLPSLTGADWRRRLQVRGAEMATSRSHSSQHPAALGFPLAAPSGDCLPSRRAPTFASREGASPLGTVGRRLGFQSPLIRRDVSLVRRLAPVPSWGEAVQRTRPSIIDELQRDDRATNQELAQRVGPTPAPCLRSRSPRCSTPQIHAPPRRTRWLARTTTASTSPVSRTQAPRARSWLRSPRT